MRYYRLLATDVPAYSGMFASMSPSRIPIYNFGPGYDRGRKVKDSAPLKLPARYCSYVVLPRRLEHTS